MLANDSALRRFSLNVPGALNQRGSLALNGPVSNNAGSSPALSGDVNRPSMRVAYKADMTEADDIHMSFQLVFVASMVGFAVSVIAVILSFVPSIAEPAKTVGLAGLAIGCFGWAKASEMADGILQQED